LLLIFFTVVRTLGERTRPVEAALDCRHVERHDVTALERCLEVRPRDVEMMADLGAAYEQRGQWDRAESTYRRALGVDAEDGDIRVRLGSILLRRGDAVGALREGVAALAVQPGRAPALDLIGRAEAAASAGRDR
jgi:Flp pilus assembly protein TadD